LRVAALLGPTASGKTAAAVALRKRGLPLEAVGCDALQLYRRLDAATAKPSADERALLPHHLVDVAEPDDAQTAGRYVELADTACAEIRARGHWPLLVGGTGLYHRAFVRGLAPIDPIPPEVRQTLAERHRIEGAEALHAELSRLDPVYAAATPASNRQRVLRALEVVHGTGRPLSAWHEAHAAGRDRVDCITIVLEPERQWLHRRIETRARAMVQPLLNEVEGLLDEGLSPKAPAMQAIGYRDAVEVVQGQGSAEALAERLVIAHRRYARRQRTWFRRTQAALRLRRLDADGLEKVAAALGEWFGQPEAS